MSEGTQAVPRKASMLEAARTVLSAFVGVRRRADHERDTVAITPVQIVVMAVALVALFIFTLLTIVRFVVG
jgi:hypothetical protein